MENDTVKTCLGCLAIYALPCIAALLYGFGVFDPIISFVSNEFYNHRYYVIAIAILLISMCVLVIWLVKKKKSLIASHQRKVQSLNTEHDKIISVMESNFYRQKNVWEIEVNTMKYLIKSSSPFKEVASMFADVETYIYEQSAEFINNRRRPASHTMKIREMRKNTMDWITAYKEMEYKYSYLLSVLPELSEHFDSLGEIEEDINEAAEHSSQPTGDEDSDWLTDEEYERLRKDENAVAQLALDRWTKHHHHSKKAVGDDYEMYIAYLYKKDGWLVDYHGIENGLNDLGRDLIAYKIIDNVRTFHVVQCKYWNTQKTVHENVVCQTFGTSYEFFLRKSKELKPYRISVIPYVISTTQLSDTALAFAQKLNVSFKLIPMDDYPRIKCNINKGTGEKIYHLPFDQQYYNTLIKDEGEFYALTVKEAVSKGFRRAHRNIDFDNI